MNQQFLSGVGTPMNVKQIGNGVRTLYKTYDSNLLDKSSIDDNLQHHNKLQLRVKGGAIKNAGWDPKHPRLSRDPNWYQGRGKDNAKQFGNSVLKGLKIAAEVVPELL